MKIKFDDHKAIAAVAEPLCVDGRLTLYVALGAVTVDTLMTQASGADTSRYYEDSEVTATYTGYTELNSVLIVGGGISVTVINPDYAPVPVDPEDVEAAKILLGEEV